MTAKQRKFVEALMCGFIQGSPHPNLWDAPKKIQQTLAVCIRIAEHLDAIEAGDV